MSYYLSQCVCYYHIFNIVHYHTHSSSPHTFVITTHIFVITTHIRHYNTHSLLPHIFIIFSSILHTFMITTNIYHFLAQSLPHIYYYNTFFSTTHFSLPPPNHYHTFFIIIGVSVSDFYHWHIFIVVVIICHILSESDLYHCLHRYNYQTLIINTHSAHSHSNHYEHIDGHIYQDTFIILTFVIITITF